MFIFTAILTIIFAIALVFFGYPGVIKSPQLLGQYKALNIPENLAPVFGGAQILGAIGLLIGLYWAPLGILAGICLVIFYIVAVLSHLRAGDKEHYQMAAILIIASLVILILRIVTKG